MAYQCLSAGQRQQVIFLMTLPTAWFSASPYLQSRGCLSQKAVLWCTFPVLPPQRASFPTTFLYLFLPNTLFTLLTIYLA